MRYSKFIVALVILLNSVFAGAVLLVFWHTGNEPQVLIGAFYAFTTGELWLLAEIKKNKEQGYGKTNMDQETHEP